MTTRLVPTEAQEATTLVAYLKFKGYKFTHIANETGSSPEARRRAIRLKREGVSRGFPDYLVFNGTDVIAIELKRVRGSKVTPEQVAWIDTLNAHGISAAICKGAEQAINFIETGIETGGGRYDI